MIKKNYKKIILNSKINTDFFNLIKILRIFKNLILVPEEFIIQWF